MSPLVTYETDWDYFDLVSLILERTISAAFRHNKFPAGSRTEVWWETVMQTLCEWIEMRPARLKTFLASTGNYVLGGNPLPLVWFPRDRHGKFH